MCESFSFLVRSVAIVVHRERIVETTCGGMTRISFFDQQTGCAKCKILTLHHTTSISSKAEMDNFAGQ